MLARWSDGKASSAESTFKLDGKDYPISCVAEYDTLSKDGKVLALAGKGKSASGTAYNNVMVFDRK